MGKRGMTKPGRPSSGLRCVLYIRARPDLIAQLDRLVELEQKCSAGRVVSRSDVAREILYEGILKRGVTE